MPIHPHPTPPARLPPRPAEPALHRVGNAATSMFGTKLGSAWGAKRQRTLTDNKRPVTHVAGQATSSTTPNACQPAGPVSGLPAGSSPTFGPAAGAGTWSTPGCLGFQPGVFTATSHAVAEALRSGVDQFRTKCRSCRSGIRRGREIRSAGLPWWPLQVGRAVRNTNPRSRCPWAWRTRPVAAAAGAAAAGSSRGAEAGGPGP